MRKDNYKKSRCRWSKASPDFVEYHDEEWGVPTANDRELFEKLCLESFQSGLSWRTILSKRENFRAAFLNFDFDIIAEFDAIRVEQLLNDTGIVRHRGKIEAVINNAKCAKEMVCEEGSLAAFFWSFEVDEDDIQPQSRSHSDASIALSKELKKMGWKFFGPTTAFAFMQAAGIINDHSPNCFRREEIDILKSKFQRPLRTRT